MSKLKPLAILRSIKVELRQVKWPTHQQALKLTLIVVLVSFAVGLYISGLDVLFTKFIQSLIT